MKIDKECSIRKAAELLDKKGALKTCRVLVEKCDGQLKDEPELLEELGFEAETPISVKGLRPRFDAFHGSWKIGVELEKREQMNVRSHLLFTEIAFRKKLIDVAVYILPVRGENQGKKANFTRTRRELTETELFSEEYFPLMVPIYLIGYR